MKDEKKREKGKYTEIFQKEKDGVIYTMTEVFVIGKDYEILNYSREYNPGIKYPLTFEEI